MISNSLRSQYDAAVAGRQFATAALIADACGDFTTADYWRRQAVAGAEEPDFIAEYKLLDASSRALMLRVMRVTSADHDALQRLVDSLAGVDPADKAGFIGDWLEIQEAA